MKTIIDGKDVKILNANDISNDLDESTGGQIISASVLNNALCSYAAADLSNVTTLPDKVKTQLMGKTGAIGAKFSLSGNTLTITQGE